MMQRQPSREECEVSSNEEDDLIQCPSSSLQELGEGYSNYHNNESNSNDFQMKNN
jgi:hypothetical protein